MKYGFIRVATAIPVIRVADCKYNSDQIEQLLIQANAKGVEVVCFPELSITGYTCQDLFHQQLLIEEAERALLHLVDFSRNLSVVSIVGLPMLIEEQLYNCAVVVASGRILGVVPKTHLPNYKEFYEQRWFVSGASLPTNVVTHICGQEVPVGVDLLFEFGACCFGVEICEDLWATMPPSSVLALSGADVIFNLSASDELVGKSEYLKALVQGQSGRCICGYVYASCGYGESTQDVVYAGRSYIAENGTILAEGKAFQMENQLMVSEIDIEKLRNERRVNTTFGRAAQGRVVRRVSVPHMIGDNIDRLSRKPNAKPFVPQGTTLDVRCRDILNIQSYGLAKRIEHAHAETVVVGISGGLDSTLALLVCALAFDHLNRDRKGIVGITMPGFGTTDRTYHNAVRLMKNMGVTMREIPIADACRQHFVDLNHDESVHDVTYENIQARERTQILMNAANQMNGLVIGTGDLSELALGWATYNGDHMSMYGVNASVPKTLVRHLVVWAANNLMDEFTREVLLDIVDTPISPELIPANPDGTIQQKTEDLVGPYELHDFFLYNILRHGFRPAKIYWLAQQAFEGLYSNDQLIHWLRTFCRRFFQQQFKRSCLPDGPKVGSCSLSPRGDWRMPSDASSALWIQECDSLVD